jgi:two-component system cell cycle response regulator DivK
MLGADATSSPQVKRILVVEDNELNMKLLNDVLEAHGYAVMSTSHGAVAVEWARQYRPDLILMDLQLPDLSGLEATRASSRRIPQTRDIPVIAVTAFAMAGDENARRSTTGATPMSPSRSSCGIFSTLIAGFIGVPEGSRPV